MRRCDSKLVLVVGLVLVSACAAPAPPATGGVGAGDATGSPRAGGRVVLGILADVAGLNPLLKTDPQSATAARRIYDSLVIDDPKTGEPRPRLAESWTASSDGTSLTFTLRDNLTWSDGSPLTVDDVTFTLMATLRSKIAPGRGIIVDEIVGAQDFATGRTQAIAGVVSSGRTLTVRLTQPLCTAVTDIGGRAVLPKSVFGKYLDPTDTSKTIDDAPENNAPLLASGPFRFREWVPRDHVTLVRNDRFFLGPPPLEEWVYRVLPTQASIVAALKTGEIDVGMVGFPAVEDMRASGLQVLSTPGTGYTYIAWNQLRGGKEFFGDKAVRQALSYGLNWDQIIATQLGGQGQRVVSHTPPPSWAYDPLGLNPYLYDPEKARQLLEVDGWTLGADGIYQKNGQRLAFTLLTNPETSVRTSIVQIAAEQYRQIGVEATPRTEAFEAFLQRTISSKDPTYGDQGGRDFDAFLIGWGQIGPDPDAYWYWHSSQLQVGGNRIGYRNSVVDQALDTGRTHCAPADRRAAYHQMDLQLNEDQPVSFGFVTNTLLAVNPQIKGVDPGPYSFLAQWNVEQWWRAP